jgi:sugar transferase (PEP-CTERM system associated)
MIYSSRTSPYIIGFLAGEALLMFLGTALAVYIRVADPTELFTWKYSWHRLLLVPVVLEISFYYFDLFNFRQARRFWAMIVRVLQAMAVGSAALTVIYYAVPRLFLGRGVMLLAFLIISGFVLVWRLGYGWALTQRIFATRLLLVGSGNMMTAILEELVSRSDNVYRVVCLVSTDSPNGADDQIAKTRQELQSAWARLLRANLHDSSDDVLGLVRYYHADMVVVAMDEKRGSMPLDDLLRCRMQGIPIRGGEDFYEDISGRILSEQIRPSWMVFSPSGFRANSVQALSKRAFDISVSLIGITLASPLALLTALAVRLDSPGPILFKQERVGQFGKLFTMYKFRSMVMTAEDETGPVWSTEGDARITKVGRFIRKTRLDEIPQMWNVLKGEMSFVGPRPERPHFVELLKKKFAFYDERHNVKPGVTGWAQVCYPYGASEAAALEKLNYDLYYIKHSNMGMDLMVLFQTAKILLLGEGGR